MRWAFWRRSARREQQRAQVADEVTSCWPLPGASPPEEQDVREPAAGAQAAPGAPAFSGTQPGPPPELAPGAPRGPLEGPLPTVDPSRARGAVLRLSDAARQSDAGAVQAALQELTAHGAEHVDLAARGALAVLGSRLAVLAGHEGDPLAPGGLPWRAVVAQGDHTAGRAERTRRAVAPSVPSDLLRFAVRFACATPEADPALARHAAAPPRDLLLASVLLLAQAAEDGAAPVDAGELAELLPDS